MDSKSGKPITFDSTDVKAVLAGSKTQHRFVLSSQPKMTTAGWQVLDIDGVRISNQSAIHTSFDAAVKRVLPSTSAAPYRVGDRLWVKEDFIPDPPADHDAWEDEDSVTNYFSWDGCGSKLSEIPKRLRKPKHVIYKSSWDNPDSMIWVKASRMRKWASRIMLEVTDIRVERLQDITLRDVLAGGCNRADMKNHDKYGSGSYLTNALEWFKDHWYGKNPAITWIRNDFVWVIDFKVVSSK